MIYHSKLKLAIALNSGVVCLVVLYSVHDMTLTALIKLFFLKEDWVQFQFDGMPMAFRGTLTVVSADNLASWSIGGFKALASAFRKCQYCMAVDEDMQTKVLYIIEIICK